MNIYGGLSGENQWEGEGEKERILRGDEDEVQCI
jgi:hypothetical protein